MYISSITKALKTNSPSGHQSRAGGRAERLAVVVGQDDPCMSESTQRWCLDNRMVWDLKVHVVVAEVCTSQRWWVCLDVGEKETRVRISIHDEHQPCVETEYSAVNHCD